MVRRLQIHSSILDNLNLLISVQVFFSSDPTLQYCANAISRIHKAQDQTPTPTKNQYSVFVFQLEGDCNKARKRGRHELPCIRNTSWASFKVGRGGRAGANKHTW